MSVGHGKPGKVSWQARLLCGVLKWVVKPLAWRSKPDPAHFKARSLKIDRWFAAPHLANKCEAPFDVGRGQCQWLRFGDAPTKRVLLYLHGGGFTTHLPNVYVRFCHDLGRRLQADVLMVDYRLAPDHPFPAGPQDCLEAYRWLIETNGTDAGQIVMAGDSAGGNLVLVTTLMIKQAGLPKPAAAWSMSPGVDCNWHNYDLEQLCKDCVMFSHKGVPVLDAYFGQADRNDWRISPLFGDLSDLPPLLIEAGAREFLRTQPAMFAERASEQGSVVQTRIWPGMPHVHQAMGFLPEAQQARAMACQFLLEHIGD